jgi:hypothetical protein
LPLREKLSPIAGITGLSTLTLNCVSRKIEQMNIPARAPGLEVCVADVIELMRLTELAI